MHPFNAILMMLYNRSLLFTKCVQASGIFTFVVLLNTTSAENALDPDLGARTYAIKCANCHETPALAGTTEARLRKASPEQVLLGLTKGGMGLQDKQLTTEERLAIIEYLTGKAPSAKQIPVAPICTPEKSQFDFSDTPKLKSWGNDLVNSRFVEPGDAGLNIARIPKLKLKWSLAFPHAYRVRSQPAIGGGAVFVGSQDGTLYALDQDSGCIRWTFAAEYEIRSAILITPWKISTQKTPSVSVYFGDLFGNVYSVDAISGQLRWKTNADKQSIGSITGAPVLYRDRLFVPLSANPQENSYDPTFECCTGRGSIVALDANNGNKLWQTYSIQEPAKLVGKTKSGARIFGPSGASVWGSPTIDEKANQLYFGTGNNHSSPATDTSDAIIALDIETGEIQWYFQGTADDAWNNSCITTNRPSCPVEDGPDNDFGAPPILIESGGKRVLVAGQKSGVVFGLDPDNEGAVLWQKRLGRGGEFGGVHFGLAAEDKRVYVPIMDLAFEKHGGDPYFPASPGLTALDALTGKEIWSVSLAENCSENMDWCMAGISAPASAIAGAVFVATMDGHVHAYDGKSGQLLWQYDTTQESMTLGGQLTRGGIISGGAGPIVAGRKLYVSSGYGLYHLKGGNAFRVFSAE